MEITLKQIYKGTGTYLNELGGGLTCNDDGNTLATVSGNIGSAEKSFTINFYDSDGDPMADCETAKIEDINQLKSTGKYAGATRAVQMAVAAGSLQCTHGSRAWNSASVSVPSGEDATALEATGTGSSTEGNTWGIRCVNGYVKTSCYLSTVSDAGQTTQYYDTDIFGGADESYCLTDDEEYDGRATITAICCK